MRAYTALTLIHLKLAFREKTVLFFTYVFPLVFLFGFGQFVGLGSGAQMTRIVSMVLVMGILGTGLFGGGLRAVQEREMNILRRYKVTPISPLPLLAASMVTGLMLNLPAAAMVVLLSKFAYAMPWPERWLPLLLFVTVGSVSMRAIGLIIYSVANTMAEANILLQLLYLPMLLLSGATFPITVMPAYLQIVAQFIPTSYLNTGMQHVLLRSEGLGSGLEPLAALLLSTAVALWVAVKLFRWDKEERIPNRSKAWVAAAFVPFLLLGAREAYSRDQINSNRMLDRDMRRRQARLIRDARIFAGDGKVIERGSVLIRNGQIERVFEGTAPSPESVKAAVMEAAGKTVLPGLIDVHVHLGAPGAPMSAAPQNQDPAASMKRAASAYLYSGVIAVKSAGDFTGPLLGVRGQVNRPLHLGAEIFLCGPLFTAEGGHGTEYFRDAPEFLKQMAEREFTRIPKTADEAREQVRALKRQGVDGIKAVLEAGVAGNLFQRMDVTLLRTLAEQARAEGLPLVVHTGDSRDIADALDAGAQGIEHGSARDRIPDELLARMKQLGVYYDPALSVIEAFADLRAGRLDLLSRTLVEQAAPAGLLALSRQRLGGEASRTTGQRTQTNPAELAIAMDNLARAWRAGVMVVTGTDSGNPLLIHGPAIHRELQLWVKAGVPARAALAAATETPAKLLRIADRVGMVRPGYEASLLIVDGNPVEDIAATERISAVLFKGERVDRPGLFDQK